MTLNGVMVLFCIISANSGIPGALRKSSRSLSHLLMSSCICYPHVYPWVEWYILAFTPQPQSVTALCLVLISHPAEGKRLSWPRNALRTKFSWWGISSRLFLTVEGNRFPEFTSSQSSATFQITDTLLVVLPLSSGLQEEFEDAVTPLCGAHVRSTCDNRPRATGRPWRTGLQTGRHAAPRITRRRIPSTSAHDHVCCCSRFLLRCSRRPGSLDLGAFGMF